MATLVEPRHDERTPRPNVPSAGNRLPAVPEPADQADRRLARVHGHDLVLTIGRDIVIVVVLAQVAFERRAYTGIVVNS